MEGNGGGDGAGNPHYRRRRRRRCRRRLSLAASTETTTYGSFRFFDRTRISLGPRLLVGLTRILRGGGRGGVEVVVVGEGEKGAVVKRFSREVGRLAANFARSRVIVHGEFSEVFLCWFWCL
nr:hypothetical protein Iba_chr11eCG8860 [Ipomoea batatas]